MDSLLRNPQNKKKVSMNASGTVFPQGSGNRTPPRGQEEHRLTTVDGNLLARSLPTANPDPWPLITSREMREITARTDALIDRRGEDDPAALRQQGDKSFRENQFSEALDFYERSLYIYAHQLGTCLKADRRFLPVMAARTANASEAVLSPFRDEPEQRAARLPFVNAGSPPDGYPSRAARCSREDDFETRTPHRSPFSTANAMIRNASGSALCPDEYQTNAASIRNTASSIGAITNALALIGQKGADREDALGLIVQLASNARSQEQSRTQEHLESQTQKIDQLLLIISQLQEQINQCNQKYKELERKVSSLEERMSLLEHRLLTDEETLNIIKQAFSDETSDQKWKEEAVGFKNNMDLNDYFRSFLSQLEAAYIGAKAIESHFVAQEKPGFYAKGAEYVGHLLELIPELGKIFSVLVKETAEMVDAKKDAEDNIKVLRLPQLAQSTEEFDRIALRIAVESTRKNKNYISRLQHAQAPASWKDKLKALFTGGKQEFMIQLLKPNESQAVVLGRFDAIRVIAHLQQESVTQRLATLQDEPETSAPRRKRNSLISSQITSEVFPDAAPPAASGSPVSSPELDVLIQDCHKYIETKTDATSEKKRRVDLLKDHLENIKKDLNRITEALAYVKEQLQKPNNPIFSTRWFFSCNEKNRVQILFEKVRDSLVTLTPTPEAKND